MRILTITNIDYPRKMKRLIKAKPGELKMQYGRLKGDNPDVCYSWGGAGATSCDASFLHWALSSKRATPNFPNGVTYEPSFVEELEKRGYDITTIRFSIMKRIAPAIEQKGT